MVLPLNILVRVAVEEGPLASRPPAFPGVCTERALERSPVSGGVVELGGKVSVPFTAEVAHWLLGLRDEEARLEPKMGPRPFGDDVDALSGGESAGSSGT